MTANYSGGCFCGAVRYVARGEPVNSRVCHCRMCQKAVGAAFNARVLFMASDVEVTGPVRTFHSSPELERGFCGTCGTTLYSARPSAGVIGLTAGSLDEPSLFQPTMHIWTASRQPWLCLDDGIAQHEGAAPPS
ncbi:MAG TPA: GFA family protein [Caulobacteraceae bacterium]|nr:GFA family protein [Caulobacteraceae bacterium]